MKAVRIHQPGSVGQLRLRRCAGPDGRPRRSARSGASAVALNHLEAWAAKAPSSVRYEQPRILGADVAGTIEGVGPGVASLHGGRGRHPPPRRQLRRLRSVPRRHGQPLCAVPAARAGPRRRHGGVRRRARRERLRQAAEPLVRGSGIDSARLHDGAAHDPDARAVCSTARRCW